MNSSGVRRIDPEAPADAILTAAAAVIRAGGLVAFPTETVYGLGANALDERAVRRLFATKGRPASNPLIVHVAERSQVNEVAAQWPESAQRLAERFWPGPLTLVVFKQAKIPSLVTAGGPTIAVRMPGHNVALGLIRSSGVPLAAPSANRSGTLSPTSAEHVVRGLGGAVDLILDGGATEVGVESTVIDLTVSPPRLLRPGHIPPTQIEEVIGPIQRQGHPAEGAVPRSPGMLSRHYAPQTPLECVANGPERVASLVGAGERVGWLTFQVPKTVLPENVRYVVMPSNAAEYAARLFAELHRLDEMGLDRIVVESPPETEPWLAVRDRLKRAAAGP
jgi:L-threonylcarbamoyladenylate synthase